jgi:ACS family hexuronate transporter-like MFS transporter
MLILWLTGWVLGDKPNAASFAPLFILAATAYLASLLIIHLLVPRLEPARVEG